VKKHNIPQKVADVLKDIGETSKTATWDCHGTVVILHKALEKVAAHEGITFDAPVVIESNVEKKMVVILVTGRSGDKVEWSFGEAAPYNLKNNYPFAMAEKRAKDRVILKLVGLHGDAYSETEADEFNEAKPPKLVQESYEDMVSKDQIIAIKKLLDETKSDKARFLTWLKVENIDQVLASDYDRAIAAIEAKL
jgi:hypothetical protein